MKLLITPAFRLDETQREELGRRHTLYFLEDERIPMEEQKLEFDPAEIEGIVCNFFFLSNKLTSLPSLRYIQLTSAGLDRVPLQEIRQKDITLRNAGDIYAVPMAEWILCKILEICKESAFFAENKSLHRWEKSRTIRELAGKKAAIIGFGNFGRNLSRRLKAFDVRVSAVDVLDRSGEDVDEFYYFEDYPKAVEDADIVVLALPLLENTFHFADKAFFDRLKDGVIFANAARGKLVDEKALLEAMESGKLLGAALDVFEQEPLPADSPLWDNPRILISPHNAFVGEGNAGRLYDLVKRNLEETTEV